MSLNKVELNDYIYISLIENIKYKYKNIQLIQVKFSLFYLVNP